MVSKSAQAAFMKVYGVDKEVVESDRIQQWINEALTELVDVDRLPNEDATGADKRRRMAEVYSGNIDNLALYLRDLYPDSGSFTKYELIYKVYNGIKNVNPIIEEVLVEVEDSKDETTSNASEETLNAGSLKEVSQVNSEPSTKAREMVDAEPQEEDNVPSGNLHSDQDENSLSNKLSQEEEENKMGESNLEALNQLANTQQNMGGNAAKPVSGAAEDMSMALHKALDEAVPRTEWTASNQVERLIAVNEPTSLRLANVPGRLGKDEATAKANIAKLLNNFAEVTGYDVTRTYNDEDGLKAKFPKLSDVTEMENANRVLGILRELKADPYMEVPVWHPEKVAYSIKGFVINGKKLNAKEMQALMFDQSNGVVYASNAIGANGEVSGEGCSFSIAVTTVTKKAAKSANGEQASAVKVSKSAIRIRNKASFAVSGNMIIVYPTMAEGSATPENMRTVKLKAAMTDESGKSVPASFKYETTVMKVDNTGKKEPQTVTKTFSIPVYGKALPSVTDVNAELANEENVADRFGKPYGTRTAEEAVDWTDVEAVRKAYAGKTRKKADGTTESRPNAFVRLLSAVQSGAIVIEGSNTAGDLKNAAAAQAQAEVADAQAEMEDLQV